MSPRYTLTPAQKLHTPGFSSGPQPRPRPAPAVLQGIAIYGQTQEHLVRRKIQINQFSVVILKPIFLDVIAISLEMSMKWSGRTLMYLICTLS